ncbi:hypothetical protein MTO96_032042 [Rhipicephalus appendiculatus]
MILYNLCALKDLWNGEERAAEREVRKELLEQSGEKVAGVLMLRMSASRPEREKSDMSRTLQLVTEYSELRGFTEFR